MNALKRLTTIAVMGLMALSLFGCGGNKATPTAATTTTTTENISPEQDSSTLEVKPDVSVPLDEAHFPDKNFRRAVQSLFETDDDNELSAEEIANSTILDAYGDRIADATGIQYLTSLTALDLSSNILTSVDVSGLTNLTELVLEHNNLTSVNLSGLTNLTALHLNDNDLTSVDLSGLTNLTKLDLRANSLTSVDVSDCGDTVQVLVDDGVKVIGNN